MRTYAVTQTITYMVKAADEEGVIELMDEIHETLPEGVENVNVGDRLIEKVKKDKAVRADVVDKSTLTLPTAADFVDLAERLREVSPDAPPLVSAIFSEASQALEAAAIHLLPANDSQINELLEGRDDILNGKARAKFIAELREEFPSGPEDEIYLVSPKYVLVEQSVTTGGHYITGHETIAEAIAYVDQQEYADGWSTIGLWDTDSGTKYEPTVTTTFTASKEIFG